MWLERYRSEEDAGYNLYEDDDDERVVYSLSDGVGIDQAFAAATSEREREMIAVVRDERDRRFRETESEAWLWT